MSHIPPFDEGGVENEWTRLVYKSGVPMVLFGHRHKAMPNAFDHTSQGNVLFHNLLCERCEFVPILIAQIDEEYEYKKLWGVDAKGDTVLKVKHKLPPEFIKVDITI